MKIFASFLLFFIALLLSYLSADKSNYEVLYLHLYLFAILSGLSLISSFLLTVFHEGKFKLRFKKSASICFIAVPSLYILGYIFFSL